MAEIYTINGMVEEDLLTKTEGSFENHNEMTTWVEWHDADGTLVRRDLHVRLKQPLDLTGILEGSHG